MKISTSSAVEKIRPGIRAMTAYTLAPVCAAVKLNQNENPFDLPAAVKEEVLRRIAGRPWSRYPDFQPSRLLESLARYAGWRPEGVLAGNGSNELIQLSLTCLVREGMKVITTPPTFAVYRQMIRALGAEPLDVMLREDFQFDAEAILRTRSQAGVILLCRPNNPTGTSIETGELRRILEGFDGMVIADEAYAEFSGDSAVPLLEEFENLIVLKTFSKAFACAGLRIGYLLAAPELAREIDKVRLPYNLNFFSQTAAEVALEHLGALRETVDLILRERDLLFERLSRIDGLSPVPSKANFLLVKTSVPPSDLCGQLRERGILIRDVSNYPMLGGCVRVSVGAPEENNAVVSALREICGGI